VARLAAHIVRLGPRAVAELLTALAHTLGDDVWTIAADYQRLDVATLAAIAPQNFPPPLFALPERART
jgi:hypothetical protein